MKVYLVMYYDAYDGYYGSTATSAPMVFATKEAATAYVASQKETKGYQVVETLVKE